MKIGFMHYDFGNDGVSRVVLNNIKGIKEYDPRHEIVLIGGDISLKDSNLYEKRIIKGLFDKKHPADYNELKRKSDHLLKNLERGIKDIDALIIENPTIGLHPVSTFTFTRLNSPYLGRIHDPIEIKPALLEHFNSYNGNYRDFVYAEGGSYVAVSPTSKKNVEKFNEFEIDILPNSIIPYQYSTSESRVKAFREQLKDDKIIKDGEHLFIYPGRCIKRKNIEESILDLAGLKALTGEKYRLIVTMEDSRHESKEYKKSLENLAMEKEIECVIGGMDTEYFDKPGGFRLGDLIGLSERVLATSIDEGFGFYFIEPFLGDRNLVGRRLKGNTEYFESMGLNLDNLYNNLETREGDFGFLPSERRLELLKTFSKKQLAKIAEENNLVEKLLRDDGEIIQSNKEVICKEFDYRKIGQQLLGVLEK